MNKRVLLTVLRLAFGIAGRVAPRFTGRKAFDLFCTPPSARPVSERALGLLEQSDRSRLRSSGVELQVYRWQGVTGPTRGRVLLVHGWGSLAARFCPWVEELLARGFEVVAFDAPAHGRSQGRRMTMPLYVKAIRQVSLDHGPVDAVVGHSLGGMAGAFACAPTDLFGDARVALHALVLVAAPDRVVEIFRDFARLIRLPRRATLELRHCIEEVAGRALEQFTVSDALEHADFPVLVIHDQEDDEIPFRSARAIARNSGARLLASRGLGHNKVLTDPRHLKQGADFIEQCLNERAAA